MTDLQGYNPRRVRTSLYTARQVTLSGHNLTTFCIVDDSAVDMGIIKGRVQRCRLCGETSPEQKTVKKVR